MLKTWLDENLPELVERLGIELISRAKRLKADQDDGMKAQELLRDFDEFRAQVNKVEAGSGGGIEKTTDIKEYQAALASFRAACERLGRSLRQGAQPPPPGPSIA
jgi:hypothetical protein